MRTRTALMDAAFDVIAEAGLAGLTIAQVCEQAGRKRSSFYTHFTDLNDLLTGLSYRLLGDIGAKTNHAFAHRDHGVVLGFRIDFVLQMVRQEPALGRVICELHQAHPPTADAFTKLILFDVRNARRAGHLSISRSDAPTYAHILGASIVSLIADQSAPGGRKVKPKVAVDLLLGMGGWRAPS
ncbi:MAG: TetR/AcrR family transcriptional regulator [Pseudomonadota bacterium]